MKEHSFQKKVRKTLDNTEGLWCFSHEAMAVRGIPDVIGVYRGRFFAWELKRSENEANRTTGRIVLQKHVLGKIEKCGGVTAIVHPENFEEKYQELLSSSSESSSSSS